VRREVVGSWGVKAVVVERIAGRMARALCTMV
jgi:hypothetical protein